VIDDWFATLEFGQQPVSDWCTCSKSKRLIRCGDGRSKFDVSRWVHLGTIFWEKWRCYLIGTVLVTTG